MSKKLSCPANGDAGTSLRGALATNQSIVASPRKERMDCFASLAMTAFRYAYKSRGAIRSSFAGIFLTPLDQRVQGMPGADAPLFTMRPPQACNTAIMQHEDAKRDILEN
jgi:hypothetical protein